MLVGPLASRSPVLLTIDPGLTEAGAEAVGGLLQIYIQVEMK